MEDENEEKCLNFLDIKTKNNNGRYEFDVHCKPALTNVQIKPHSCIINLWHNNRNIQSISCKSYQRQIFESGNRISG